MAESKKNIHEGHRERLRERFLLQGLEGFQEHEVLELLLTYAIPRIDVNEHAHRLLDRFGSLAGVFDAPIAELKAVEGIGERAASLIKLQPQLMRSYQLSRINREKERCLNSAKKAGAYIQPFFFGCAEERVYLLCLDSGCRLLNCVQLSQGSETFTTVPVKKLVETAVRERAFSVILAHNHPTGVPIPSREDVQTTRNLAKALSLVDIRLVDHLVVAGNEFASMAECGYFEGSWKGL